MRRRIVSSCILACVFGYVSVTAASAPAQEATFGEIVPADVVVFVDGKNSEARERISRRYLNAFKGLIESGAHRDFFALITAELSEGEREEARNIAKQLVGLFRTPRWGQLLQSEVAFAARLSFPLPEYVCLFRVPADASAARRAELRDLITGLARLPGVNLSAVESQEHGAEVTRLELPGTPFGISLASRGDVLAVATAPMILESVLDLAEKGDGVGSIGKDPRFLGAFEGLEGPVETRAFIDVPRYVQFFRNLVGGDAAPPPGEPGARGPLAVARVVLAELGRIGPIASIDRTEGNSMTSLTRISFAAESEPGFIERLVADQKPLEDVARVIPKDATGFYATSGVDPARIYDAVVGLIRDRAFGGPNILERWDRIQDRLGFRLRDDLLSWMDGGWGWIGLPDAHGAKGREHILFVRLRDAEKPRELLRKGYERLRGFLERRGQSFEAVPMPGMEDDFWELRVGALPWCRPVVGVPGNTLVFATSVSAVERVAATFRQEAPSFASNEAFQGLGVPDGRVLELCYSDLEGALEGLANVVGGAGFVASILPARQETRPVLRLGALLTKISAFIRDVDLGLDYGAWTVYDPQSRSLLQLQKMRLVPSRPRDF